MDKRTQQVLLPSNHLGLTLDALLELFQFVDPVVRQPVMFEVAPQVLDGIEVRGVRRTGCASLDLAYLAAGRLDGFWELHLNPWDVAAGSLFVSEGGGRVTDFQGGDNYLFGKNIVASNGLIHEAILQNLNPIQGPL